MSLNELQNLQFNLKFVGKQFTKNSKRSEKEQGLEMNKAKQAIAKGNMDGARIYAQNAIRKKNEALNYLKLSARMDAVATRLDTAIKMQMVTKTMGMMVKGMDKILDTMDPEVISRLMEKFETQFENLDVNAETMDSAIGSTIATTAPEDEVNSLLNQIADENGLSMKSDLKVLNGPTPVVSRKEEVDQDTLDLEARLAKLTMK